MTRIVVTGASGNLGRKLCRHLEGRPDFEVVRLGYGSGRTEGTIDADLAIWSKGWADAFAGADAVVHLAANPRSNAAWEDLVGPNVDAMLNVGRACLVHRVGRLVFASSNWVVAGHRFGGTRLDAETPPRPVNCYGATKLFGERYGLHLHDTAGLSFVALRIGWVQHREPNLPGPHMGRGFWAQQMWLSDRDAVTGIECAVLATDVGFAIVNLVSSNYGMRWDIAAGEALLGWCPLDRGKPKITALGRAKAAVKALQWRIFGAASDAKLTREW